MVERAAAFTAARSSKPEALPRLLAIAGDADQGPLMQANALGYLRNYPDARAQSALIEALAAEHPLLRMVAASSLGGPGAQASLLRALDDSRRAVRLSALVSLVNGGVRPPVADLARFARVSAEFVEQAKMHEDDHVTQADLGLVHLLNGDLDRASQALMNSRTLDPAERVRLSSSGSSVWTTAPRRSPRAVRAGALVGPFYAAARLQLQGMRPVK